MDFDRAVRCDWVAHIRKEISMARYFKIEKLDSATFERVTEEKFGDDYQETRVFAEDGNLYIAVDENEVDSIHFAPDVLDKSEVKK